MTTRLRPVYVRSGVLVALLAPLCACHGCRLDSIYQSENSAARVAIGQQDCVRQVVGLIERYNQVCGWYPDRLATLADGKDANASCDWQWPGVGGPSGAAVQDLVRRFLRDAENPAVILEAKWTYAGPGSCDDKGPELCNRYRLDVVSVETGLLTCVAQAGQPIECTSEKKVLGETTWTTTPLLPGDPG